jgi:hypothetical protein
MSYFILDRELAIRLGFFLGILVMMAVWERVAPRRPLTISKKVRWFSNLGISLIDTLSLRLLLPITAVSMALFVETPMGSLESSGITCLNANSVWCDKLRFSCLPSACFISCCPGLLATA